MSDNKYNITFNIQKIECMASIRNLAPHERSPVQDRVFMLSQKINSFKLAKPQQSSRKYDRIQNICDQIEGELQGANQFFAQKMFDLKHVFTKISKELQSDYTKTDSLVRQHIQLTNKKVLDLIEQETDQRKMTDEKMLKFIDQETSLLRDMIEIESRERQASGIEIQQSLEADIGEIRSKMQETDDHFHGKMSRINSHFKMRCEKLREELKETCEEYSENESDFYRLLRDLVKKVKSELAEHQAKRESTEQQILILIEKMCDNVMDNKPT